MPERGLEFGHSAFDKITAIDKAALEKRLAA